MSLGGKLFIKIFIGFWLVTTAILGSWMLSSQYFDTRPQERMEDRHAGGPGHAGPPQRFVLRTLYRLQHLPDDELQELLAQVHRQHRIDIYLINAEQRDIYAREVPEAALQIATQLSNDRRRATQSKAGKQFLGHIVYRQPAGMLRAVFVFPKPGRGLLQALGRNLWLRITLAISISGLICFGLSRLLTNRLKALQSASRRLAQGELDTRIKVRERGGDETDEVARDFNSMAAQLQDRIEAQRRLLADVSHELRSPLARLRIALALAEDDPKNITSHLQRIEQETERLDALIEQLLATQNTALTLDSHIDLVALLGQLCEDANFEGRAQHKTFVFHTDLEQAVVASSADLLHKSFENILRNALTHTGAATEVQVTLRQNGNRYQIEVADQGPGIPEEELAKIFVEFYRVDTARSRESGGHGLGLSIARRAILRHGGQIEASNTSRGLLLTVTLPMDAENS
jgi:two-component system sensor histidine kinase CpxA